MGLKAKRFTAPGRLGEARGLLHSRNFAEREARRIQSNRCACSSLQTALEMQSPPGLQCASLESGAAERAFAMKRVLGFGSS